MNGGSIRDTVIVFPGALGDFLLALPALRALARRRGGRTVVVVSEPLRTLAALALPAAVVLSLDAAESVGLFRDGPAPGWLTPGASLYSWLGSGDAAMRARLGRMTARACFWPVVRGPGREHAAVVYGRQVGIPVAWRALVAAARLAPPESPAARALSLALRPPVLAVAPGAGSLAKRWGRGALARVVAGWRAGGGEVLEIVGPAEHDLPPLDGTRVVREWALPDLAALLAGAHAWLGSDSGPSHLAGAVGLGGRVLFGPTEPRRWRPLSFRLRALRARPARGGRASIDTLSPARVLGALESLTTPTPRSSVRRCRAPRDGAVSARE